MLFQYIGKGTEKGGRDPKISAKRVEKWNLIFAAFNKEKLRRGEKPYPEKDNEGLKKLKGLRNREIAKLKEQGWIIAMCFSVCPMQLPIMMSTQFFTICLSLHFSSAKSNLCISTQFARNSFKP